MRNKLNTTILCILLTAVNVLAKEGPPNSEPVALTVIWDASSSVRSSWSELSSLSRQAISSLRPNDYLEVISAHSSRPRLRAAQFIQSGSAEEAKTISSLLRNITCPLLVDAHVAKAVELAFKRLDRFWSKKPDRKIIVIVLTDGRLRDSEAKKICQIAAELRKRNWQLYLTGTYQTNKKLLVSASQGLFNWSLISQANPSLWIQKLHKDLLKGGEDLSLTKPTSAITQRILKDANGLEQAQDHLDDSAKNDQSTKARFTIKGEFEGPFSVLPPEETLPSEPAIERQEVPQESEQSASEITEPMQQEQPEEPELPLPPSEPKRGKTPSKYFWWILSSVATLLTAFAIILLVAAKKASELKAKIGSHLKTIKSQHPGILVAKLNGRTYRLGNLERLKAIHIGSGVHNTIRIMDKSVSNCHLRIYRKGSGIMLGNLGRTPVTVNGSQVKPRGKHRLMLPSVIRLSDKTKLNLAILKPKVNSQQDRRNEQNGDEKK